MARLPVPDINSLLKLLALTIILKYLHRFYYRSRYWPPGPRGLPILGNIFQLPSFSWFAFTKWKAQYGPIISLNLAGQPMIVLNTAKVAGDLLSRRARIYSDRPPFIMAREILTGGMSLVFISYADPLSRWRRMRRATHEVLNVRSVEEYRSLQEVEAAHLVTNLLRSPDDWDYHFKRSAASTVLCVVYGWDPVGFNGDDIIEKINGQTHRLADALLPGAHLVEIFPIIKYLPPWIAKWKREGLEWFVKDTKMFEDLLSEVNERRLFGNCPPCFASSLLENQSRLKLEKEEAAWLTGVMFGAGSETTAAVLAVFLLAMVLHPEVMQKAQAEIDGIVGRDRIPTFRDFDKLPYIQAMVKEVLRWRTIAPLGIPRCTTESDWYEGYYIPKGALVVANIWAMHRDPELFPDPDEFRPSRFLDASGNINHMFADNVPLGHVTYGFGKRICSGLNLANQSIFIDIACMLWALDIDKATDDRGNLIVPSSVDFIEGIVVRPAPFTCKIKARSGDVAAMLEHAKTGE
ncbi:cytochrome P450 [Collybia nuda]|uniref:Cytochrome P450 n=1 Tax=Collybia nuda TaxID=64659 RepID=A0A9P5Y743_9AGAR|nr:cytochrome P450 [Collybia nuda]